MRERPGSLAVPPFAATERLTVPDLHQPLGPTKAGRSTHQANRRGTPMHGLTEDFLTVLDRDVALRKSGSVSVPPPFYTLHIVSDDGHDLPVGAIGEIVGRDPNSFPCLQSDDVPRRRT